MAGIKLDWIIKEQLVAEQLIRSNYWLEPELEFAESNY